MPAYDALVVRSGTQVTREVIEAAPNLRVIGRAGMGVDNVDVAAATERGIIVCNAPTSNIVSAAEHTMALMLACARNVAQANASMHEGKWERSRFTGVELYEKTLAIFGLGRVGGLVAERARAFGMKLVGYDPYCSPERAEQLGVKLYDTVDEIVPLADFITVHLPKTEETIGMFGPRPVRRHEGRRHPGERGARRHLQRGLARRLPGRRQDRRGGPGRVRVRALHWKARCTSSTTPS